MSRERGRGRERGGERERERERGGESFSDRSKQNLGGKTTQ